MSCWLAFRLWASPSCASARRRGPTTSRPTSPSLYIAPESRHQGLGRVFLTDVLDHCRSRGATYVDLNTSEDDEAARHLYESLGFDCHEGRGSGPMAIYYEKQALSRSALTATDLPPLPRVGLSIQSL